MKMDAEGWSEKSPSERVGGIFTFGLKKGIQWDLNSETL